MFPTNFGRDLKWILEEIWPISFEICECFLFSSVSPWNGSPLEAHWVIYFCTIPCLSLHFAGGRALISRNLDLASGRDWAWNTGSTRRHAYPSFVPWESVYGSSAAEVTCEWQLTVHAPLFAVLAVPSRGNIASDSRTQSTLHPAQNAMLQHGKCVI